MSKARVKPNSSFLKKKNQKSGLLIGEIKVKSCVGMKLRKSATSAKSGTFSPQFKNKPEAALPAARATPLPSPLLSPAPAPSQSNNNILFDISTFSDFFNFETGYRVNKDEAVLPRDLPLPPKAMNALTRAANRWAHFLSFTPEYIKVMNNLVPGWKGITLDRFQISTIDFFTSSGWLPNTLAKSVPNVKVADTSFITGGQMCVSENYLLNLTEDELFHILSHELGHILGFPCMRVRNGGDWDELLPNIYVDPAGDGDSKFYDELHFRLAVDAYIHKYKGKTKDRGNTIFTSCDIDISPIGLIPLEYGVYKHWSPTTITYDETALDPNLYNPDACTNEHLPYLYLDERPMVIFRGLYNEIMVPEWDAKIDSESGYFITEITLGALAALYTPWDGNNIRNYTLLRGSRTIGASEARDFNLKDDTIYSTINFSGNIIGDKEIKDEEEKDKSWSKGPIIHKCSVCEPIYLDACGDCA